MWWWCGGLFGSSLWSVVFCVRVVVLRWRSFLCCSDRFRLVLDVVNVVF